MIDYLIISILIPTNDMWISLLLVSIYLLSAILPNHPAHQSKTFRSSNLETVMHYSSFWMECMKDIIIVKNINNSTYQVGAPSTTLFLVHIWFENTNNNNNNNLNNSRNSNYLIHMNNTLSPIGSSNSSPRAKEKTQLHNSGNNTTSNSIDTLLQPMSLLETPTKSEKKDKKKREKRSDKPTSKLSTDNTVDNDTESGSTTSHRDNNNNNNNNDNDSNSDNNSNSSNSNYPSQSSTSTTKNSGKELVKKSYSFHQNPPSSPSPGGTKGNMSRRKSVATDVTTYLQEINTNSSNNNNDH